MGSVDWQELFSFSCAEGSVAFSQNNSISPPAIIIFQYRDPNVVQFLVLVFLG